MNRCHGLLGPQNGSDLPSALGLVGGIPIENSANWNDWNSIFNKTNSFLCPLAICYLLVLLQLQSISRRQTARFRSSGREFSGVKVSPTGAPSMWGQSLSNYAQEHQVCGVRVGVTVHYVQVLSWLRAAVGADKRGVGMSDEMSTGASLSRGLDRGGGGVVQEPVMQQTA